MAGKVFFAARNFRKHSACLIFACDHIGGVELIRIYQCLCEPTRLRILHLLTREPLCVCHFQEVLEIPQTKVSQHLAYLRKRGMVETERRGTWIIYSLPAEPSPELTANLKCLQDCVTSEPLFHDDLIRLAALKSCDGVNAARIDRMVP